MLRAEVRCSKASRFGTYRLYYYPGGLSLGEVERVENPSLRGPRYLWNAWRTRLGGDCVGTFRLRREAIDALLADAIKTDRHHPRTLKPIGEKAWD